jgi:N-dimethylarginine dimethylaminohydrolase
MSQDTTTEQTAAATWSQYNSHGRVRKLLLCAPDYYQELPISEIASTSMDAGDKVDLTLAKRMHAGLAVALQEAGVELEWERPHPDHYWQVYTRDFGVNTPNGPLIGKYKYEPRWGDEEFAIEAFDKLGVGIVGRVARGAVEGGDSWMLDETTLVIGSGNRSTLVGIENAAEIMKPFGVEVVPVEFLAKWNHLDMIFSVVAEKLCLYSPDGVPDTYVKFLKNKGWRLIAVPLDEVLKTGCNVLALGDGKVLSFEENPIVNDMLKAEGFEIFAPPLREFTKMGGGPHCLTFELQRDR